MNYILCQTTPGAVAFYQEVMRGQIQRYTDLSGVTFTFSGSSKVTNPSPSQPAWALADTAPPIIKLPRALRPVEFWKLFTPAEVNAVYTAVATTSSLHTWIDDIHLMDAVDRNDAVLQAKITSLETLLIIGAGRAAVIINA